MPIERAFIALDAAVRDIPAEKAAGHGIPANMIAGFRNVLARTYDDGGLVVGGATGALVERLLMWRLFDKSRLVLLVATIGISQLILLLVLGGPLKPDPQRLAADGYPQPFDGRWRVGSAVLTSSVSVVLAVSNRVLW